MRLFFDLNKTLIDQLRGGNNYRTGNWQGYREDIHVIVDLSVSVVIVDVVAVVVVIVAVTVD